jgi:hypothetical protein
VTGGAADGWSGEIGHPVQQVAERGQMPDGYYNASTHYHYGITGPVPKQRCGIWAYMRKRESRVIAENGDIDRPIAKKFANAIRVRDGRLWGLIGHCKNLRQDLPRANAQTARK